jgi:hypothetical protein
MIQGLKFRAKDVAKYERENKTNFAAIIGEVMAGVDSLAGVISIGLIGVNKDQAFDLIQDELDNGVDLEDIQQTVLDALANSGFMRGVISKIKVKELMEQQITPALTQMGIVRAEEAQEVQVEEETL